jgi:Uma2 family endonuclease
MEFVLKDLPLPASLITDVPMSDDELLEFCAKNGLLRVERTRSGEIKLMSPTGSGTGAANAELNRQLGNWAYDNGGVAFDSNTGFSLPDGSMMSPDAAWISDPRWSALSARDRSRFAPLCPEFVIELRSPSDSLPQREQKMALWIENGAQLAWLIDPEAENVKVYRPGAAVEVHEHPTSVQGTGLIATFKLLSARIWHKD